MAFNEWEQFADDLISYIGKLNHIECPFQKDCKRKCQHSGFLVVWDGNAQEQLGQFLKERLEFMRKQEQDNAST